MDSSTRDAPCPPAGPEPTAQAEAPLRTGSSVPPRPLGGVWWLAPFALVVVEIGSFASSQARVVPADDWRDAGGFVRERMNQARDAAVAAPRWAEPLMRQAIGEEFSVSAAGASDLASYEGLWAFSIRGHDPVEIAGRGSASLDRWFGRVRVRHYSLGPSRVQYRFVEHLADAEVSMVSGDSVRDCPWRRTGFPYGGGVLQGPMTPAERFVCPSHPWLWVGRTVTEDLELRTRECIWQHPQGPEPIRTVFRDVPLGDRIVFYGGIYHGHEHLGTGGPVIADVAVDGRSIGRFVHHDGDGWGRAEFETRSVHDAARQPSARGDVSVEVTARDPHLRTFCWNATTRSGVREQNRRGTP